ncbi:MAG: hypothetical protein WKF37_19830 [Bryobacteraceae bacterium]
MNEVLLYALDGGAEFKDIGMFSDTGEYDRKPGATLRSAAPRGDWHT